jgi:hypothetical protein
MGVLVGFRWALREGAAGVLPGCLEVLGQVTGEEAIKLLLLPLLLVVVVMVLAAMVVVVEVSS